jgi:hypothetical protein
MAEERDDGRKGGDSTDEADGSRQGRLRRLGKRLMQSGDDVRDLASAVLDTSDRAKTEMVRMVAREVRNYLDELKLKEDLVELARSHSLEVKVSLHLKPLLPDEPAKRTETAPEPQLPAKREDPSE